MRVLMACLSLALLSACGSSTNTSATSGPASTTAGSGGGPAATAAGAAPQVCSVVTQSEAAAVMGSSVTQQGGGSTCIWTTGDGHELNVEIFSAGAAAASAVQGQQCPTGSSTSVSGLGDAAISCSGNASHVLIFAKRGSVVHLQCGGNCTAVGLLTAAQAAAGRL